MTTRLTLDIVLDDTARITAHTDGSASPAVMFDTGVWLSVARDAHEAAVADSLLAAVTEWHAEIHRRAAERAEVEAEAASPRICEHDVIEYECAERGCGTERAEVGR